MDLGRDPREGIFLSLGLIVLLLLACSSIANIMLHENYKPKGNFFLFCLSLHACNKAHDTQSLFSKKHAILPFSDV